MLKIPVMFERQNGLVYPKLAQGCEWIMSGDNGLMTIKIDGICVQVSFEQGKGWVISKWNKATSSWQPTNSITDALIWKAFEGAEMKTPGIFEVYGEGINGNPHGAAGTFMIKTIPVDYTLIVARNNTKVQRGPMFTVEKLFNDIQAELMESPDIEGFVFHLENGDMELAKACKIRKKDFGIPWPTPKAVDVKTNETLIVV